MAKQSTTRKPNKNTKAESNSTIRVKSYRDILSACNNFIIANAHDRFKTSFSRNTKKKLVSYGPWLAIILLMIMAPQLLVLANNNMFITPFGFLEKILFNRDSWVLLIVVFVNIICMVTAVDELFKKSRRGWNSVYSALLVNISYVSYQLVTNLSQPAGSILSLIIFGGCLFTLIDIREYYK